MATKGLPKGYHTVTPYLVVRDAKRQIAFGRRAFGARVVELIPGEGGGIMHAEIEIGDSRVMLGEAGGTSPPMPCMLHLYVPDVDAAYRRAVRAGGRSIRVPADRFYGDRTGGVKDAAGNQWFIATRLETLTTKEIQRRATAGG